MKEKKLPHLTLGIVVTAAAAGIPAPACEPIISAATTPAAFTPAVPGPAAAASRAGVLHRPTSPSREGALTILRRSKAAAAPGKGGTAATRFSAAGAPFGSPARVQTTFDYGPYMKDLEGRLKAAWIKPKGEFLAVRTTFSIRHDGKLENIRIVKSAEVKEVDDAALRALSVANPVKPLPPGSAPSVNVTFTFENSEGSACCCGGQSCRCAQPGSCGR